MTTQKLTMKSLAESIDSIRAKNQTDIASVTNLLRDILGHLNRLDGTMNTVEKRLSFVEDCVNTYLPDENDIREWNADAMLNEMASVTDNDSELAVMLKEFSRDAIETRVDNMRKDGLSEDAIRQTTQDETRVLMKINDAKRQAKKIRTANPFASDTIGTKEKSVRVPVKSDADFVSIAMDAIHAKWNAIRETGTMSINANIRPCFSNDYRVWLGRNEHKAFKTAVKDAGLSLTQASAILAGRIETANIDQDAIEYTKSFCNRQRLAMGIA